MTRLHCTIPFRGRKNALNIEIKAKKMLVWNDGKKINNVSDEMREMLTCVDTLAVGDSVVVENLSDFEVEKMHMLKDCFLIGCKGMETIIFKEEEEEDDDDGDNGKQKRSDLLPSLQCLFLGGLPNLKSIWKGRIPRPHQRRCFSSLRFLRFSCCPMLKRIFSRGLIPHLSNLEELLVDDCCEVEEIISMEEGEEIVPIQVILPRLKKLHLLDLPKLASIVRGGRKGVSYARWPWLEEMIIRNCGTTLP